MSGYPGMYKMPAANCEDHCPKRGPALRHAHSALCADGHAPNRCCSCFVAFVHVKNCRHQDIARFVDDLGDDDEAPADDRVLPHAKQPDDAENPWKLIGMTPQEELELLERTMTPRRFQRLRFMQWLYQTKDQLR